MSIIVKITITGLLYLFTILTGLWLSYSGKPLNTLLFNTHKLIALASVIFTVIVIHNLHKNVEIRIVTLTLIIATGLFILVLFISGALLSFEKPAYKIILTIHSITPILTVITTAATIYLLISKK